MAITFAPAAQLQRPADTMQRSALASLPGSGPADTQLAKAALGQKPASTSVEADPDIKSPPRRIVLHGQDVTEIARRLDADPGFAKLRDQSSAAALARLFEDPSLPGSTAKERMDFVLDYLADPSLHDLPFRVRLPDSGLKVGFRDGDLWPISHQGAHFFSAVKLGYESNPIMRMAYRWAVIGHEMVGDEHNAVIQTLRGAAGCIFERHGQRFDDAVRAAKRGDYETVRQKSAEIVPLPELPGAWTQKQERVGNSQQDMRLSAYGWALGEEVRSGAITTPAGVAAWIHQNIEY